MKSIKSKILVSMILTVAVSLILVGGASSFLGYQGTEKTLKGSMEGTAVVTSERVSCQLLLYQNMAAETGGIKRLSDPEISLQEKKAVMQDKMEIYQFQRYNLLDLEGTSLLDGESYSDRTYFQEALKGNSYVSEPMISSVTGKVTIIISAPIWADGEVGGQVAGVLYFVPDENFLNDIVASVKVSEHGAAYILDQEGTTIAHENADLVRRQENTIRNAQSDASLKELAAIEQEMIRGETGSGFYRYNHEKKLVAYSPIPATEGWSIAINAPVTDYNDASIWALTISVLLLIAAAVAASLVAFRLALGIGTPIQECTKRLELLARGDLETPVPEISREDEVGDLVNSTGIIVRGLRTILKDIDYVLDEMGGGNFTVESQAVELYIGDFEPLLESMRRIKSKLSDVLLQIRVSAEQISSGSAQVSDGAQALAQGATEQASSVQELAATVNEIAAGARRMAQITEETQVSAEAAGGQVNQSNAQMKDMTKAMGEITETSEQISQIIGTIEDIAFQTNILALNAAVEAARAGSAGKGFAVVADEVRNLASKSDEAAKATKELISASIQSVQKGNGIVHHVTESLQKTTELAGQAVENMGRVAKDVEREAEAVSQVTEGLDQVSSVVQTNSATSEESAAASEELASQAQILKDMVAQFRLPSGEDGIAQTEAYDPADRMN